MKTKLLKVQRFFRREYRMTVYIKGNGLPLDYYSTSKKMVYALLNRTEGACHWSLYVSGPLFLEERLIDWGVKGERP